MFAATRIEHALGLVNLPGRVLGQLPGELSGGMRKRVGVARAVINSPDILLYDEPATGLDPGNVDTINDLIVGARDALGATSIVVTHDMASLESVADRVAFLDGGVIRCSESPAHFIHSKDPAIRRFLQGNRRIVRGSPTAEVAP
jgi:phospholipid/cholesterol/gamma-HCH transport system ATP-binding protein